MSIGGYDGWVWGECPIPRRQTLQEAAADAAAHDEEHEHEPAEAT